MAWQYWRLPEFVPLGPPWFSRPKHPRAVARNSPKSPAASLRAVYIAAAQLSSHFFREMKGRGGAGDRLDHNIVQLPCRTLEIGCDALDCETGTGPCLNRVCSDVDVACVARA